MDGGGSGGFRLWVFACVFGVFFSRRRGFGRGGFGGRCFFFATGGKQQHDRPQSGFYTRPGHGFSPAFFLSASLPLPFLSFSLSFLVAPSGKKRKVLMVKEPSKTIF